MIGSLSAKVLSGERPARKPSRVCAAAYLLVYAAVALVNLNCVLVRHVS